MSKEPKKKPDRKKPGGDEGPGLRQGRILLMWFAAFVCILVMVHMLTGGGLAPHTKKKSLQLNEFFALLKNEQIDLLTLRGLEEAEAVVKYRVLTISEDGELKDTKVLVLEETEEDLLIQPLDEMDEARRVPKSGLVSGGPPGGVSGEGDENLVRLSVQFPTGYLVQEKKIDEIRGQLGVNQFKALPEPFPVKGLLLSFIPWLLLIFLIWFLLFRHMRSPGGTSVLSFGKARARMASKSDDRVTFDDVAGIHEAKEEVREIIEFLRTPEKFQRLGGRIPRGILLVGSPGTGKTLLAKAIAGEADVPFFSISGSDFVEMFVGVGASRVRDLFRQAKDSSPSIVFLDEVDAVGRRRGAGLGGGNDEREQTLNAILVEMDGFETDSGVILIAATNRPDVLDPALLRPGRFDRQVVVDLPDVKGREEILKVHARDKKLSAEVELARVAKSTPFFSGADLENLLNEGALLAALKGQNAIFPADLDEARDKVQFGREKRSRVLYEEDKKISAYHETGHALVAKFTPGADPLHKVTVIPRGMALGSTHFIPERDHPLMTRKKIMGSIRVLLGGRAAEELFLDDITTGAQNDFERGTELARMMVCKWGMSDKLGPISYSENEENVFLGRDLARVKQVSEATAVEIDRELKVVIDVCYKEAREALSNNRDKVEAIVEALMKYETLDAEEVDLLLAGEALVRNGNGPEGAASEITDVVDISQGAEGDDPPKDDGAEEDQPEDDGAEEDPGNSYKLRDET